MWSQIDNAINLNAATVAQQVKLVINDPNDSIKDGKWIVIDALTVECEIREIISSIIISGTQKEVIIALPLKYAHTTSDKLYLQTSPNWDIKLFIDSNTTPIPTANRDGINAAVKDCFLNGGGIVSIPRGTYELDKLTSVDAPCIDVSNMSNIKFIGEGEGISELKLNGGNYSGTKTPIFLCNNSANLEWSNLTINGNLNGVTAAGNEMHGINAQNANSFWLHKVTFFQTVNSGIKLTDAKLLNLNNCYFLRCGSNGLECYGSTEQLILIENRWFSNEKEDVLLKPYANEQKIVNYIISKNVFQKISTSTVYSLLVSSPGCPVNENYNISDNIFYKSSVSFEQCRNLVFVNNQISSGIANLFPATFINLTGKFVCSSNFIINNSVNTQAVFCSAGLNTATTDMLIFSDNTIEKGMSQFENCRNLTYSGNLIQQSGFNSIGFRFKITQNPSQVGVSDYGDLSILDNQFINLGKSAIEIESDNSLWKCNKIHIDCNLADCETSLTNGILIKAPTIGSKPYWNEALIGTSNVFCPINNNNPAIVVFNSYFSEYNVVQDNFIVEGSPEGIIEAPQGSYAINSSVEADNNYIKNSIEASNCWMLTSELGKQMLIQDSFLDIPGTILDASSAGHVPEIDVFSLPWSAEEGTWNINNTGSGATASAMGGFTGSAVAVVLNTFENVELKGVFMKLTTTSADLVGLVFKYSDQFNMWKFYYMNGFIYIDQFVSGTSNILFTLPVSIGNSNQFVLKVMINYDIISFFYDDLLVYNLFFQDTSDLKSHGLIAYGVPGAFDCLSFKELIP